VKLGGFGLGGQGESERKDDIAALQRIFGWKKSASSAAASARQLAGALGEELALELRASNAGESPRARLASYLAPRRRSSKSPARPAGASTTIVLRDTLVETRHFSTKPKPAPHRPASPPRLKVFFASVAIVVVAGALLLVLGAMFTKRAVSESPPPPAPPPSVTPTVVVEQPEEDSGDVPLPLTPSATASSVVKKKPPAPILGNVCFCQTKSYETGLCSEIYPEPHCGCWFERTPSDWRLLCPQPWKNGCPNSGIHRGKVGDKCEGYGPENTLVTTGASLFCTSCNTHYPPAPEGSPCVGVEEKSRKKVSGTITCVSSP